MRYDGREDYLFLWQSLLQIWDVLPSYLPFLNIEKIFKNIFALLEHPIIILHDCLNSTFLIASLAMIVLSCVNCSKKTGGGMLIGLFICLFSRKEPQISFFSDVLWTAVCWKEFWDFSQSILQFWFYYGTTASVPLPHRPDILRGIETYSSSLSPLGWRLHGRWIMNGLREKS